MAKVKKYFKITKEQSDEFLRNGALLITDEKILDTYYKISEGLELVLREVKENSGSQKGYKYFKLKKFIFEYLLLIVFCHVIVHLKM